MRSLLAIGALAVLSTGFHSAAANAVEKEALVKPKQFYSVIATSAGVIIDSLDVDSVVKTATGRYTVTFQKKVEQCFPVATIFGGSSGAIRVQKVEAEPKQILVSTRSEGTATVSPDFADKSFSLVVICP